MKKKSLLFFVTLILFLSIAVSSFAMNNMANGVKNVVGGTENMIENVGNNISNGVKNGVNTVSHGAQNLATDVKNGMQNTGNALVSGTTNNNNYSATRTNTGDITIAGMTTNTWSWIIIGITAAAIVILIWSYVKQKNYNDIYIDSDEL